MERAGEKLKRVREKLGLTYRDVERASQQIASRRQNDEFTIALSRLADIEHKGTVPTIFRLYSLCAIYRLGFSQVMSWYEVPLDSMAADVFAAPLERTHLVETQPPSMFPVPQPGDGELDYTRTSFLNHLVKRWGKAGLGLLSGIDLRAHRYGMVGTDDWSMYPLLHPGSLLLIDQGKRRIVSEGWVTEFDRPIYFLETRDGYRCGWCTKDAGRLIYQPHPASLQSPEILPAGEVDVIGQITGVAMHLERRKPPAQS